MKPFIRHLAHATASGNWRRFYSIYPECLGSPMDLGTYYRDDDEFDKEQAYRDQVKKVYQDARKDQLENAQQVIPPSTDNLPQ